MRPSLIPPVPTTWNHPQEAIDWLYLQLGRVAADYLRKHPESITFAKANLERWKTNKEETYRTEDSERTKSVQRFFSHARDEWFHILDTVTVAEIASLLEEESSRAQRLRSSTPFVGEPFLDEAWVKPLRKEVGEQVNAAAASFKQYVTEKEKAAVAKNKIYERA
jgi:hypothetical protein